MPRLETFFLEEWIEHNLQIGVDKIYIYDAGNKPFNDRGGHKNRTDVFNDLHRELNNSEKNIKWGKKLHKINEIDKLQKIKFNYSENKIKNIIRSTHTKKYPVFIDLHGIKFILEE